MEDFFLEAVVADLRPRLVGTTLGRVWQPSSTRLVLDFRIPDNRLLLVSVDPSSPALYLTKRSHKTFEDGNAAQRSLAAILRKRCSGARIDALDKPRHERVVTFSMLAFDSSGKRRPCSLVVELTGRSANAYFVDDDRIAASLRPVRPSSNRALGIAYSLPTLDSRPSYASTEAREIAASVDSAAELARQVSGLSRTLVGELDARARDTSLVQALDDLTETLGAASQRAFVCELEGRDSAIALSTFPLVAALGGACGEEFPDPSAAADDYSTRVEGVRSFEQARRSLVASLRAHLDRRTRLVEGLERDVARAEGGDRLRELGELLLAQLGTAKPVEGGYLVSDYYADPPGEAIAPASDGDTAQTAAAKLFARYQRGKRSSSLAQERLGATKSEALALGRLLAEAQTATTSADLSRIEREAGAFASSAPTAPTANGRQKDPNRVPGARRFVSSDGYEILVGRTSAANDTLTFKVAKPSDIWLHTADYPGSHVIVRNPTRSAVPHQTLVEAAQIAAFYSQAKENALVDVRYSERRFITKPRGSAPGLVRLSQFKTLSVRPASEPPVKAP